MVNSKQGKEKKDWFSKIMIVQTVVCALLLGFLFISAYSDGDFASLMREEYAKLMVGDITVTDIVDAIKKLKNDSQVSADNNINAEEVSSQEYINVMSESVEYESVQIGGGDDLQFTSLDTLEGICFDEYTLDFSMIVPLDNYKITSGFGYRISPVSGTPGIHTGIDLATEYGEAIYAAADGVVLDSAYDNSYGYYIKLQHTDGYVTIYAHCSSLVADAGDVVTQGDVIAKVGSTGASTGNHLHFEIRKDNIRINPEYALTDL